MFLSMFWEEKMAMPEEERTGLFLHNVLIVE